MNNENTITPVKNESFELFKQGVYDLLLKRSYFISQVMPKLKENQDYYVNIVPFTFNQFYQIIKILQKIVF